MPTTPTNGRDQAKIIRWWFYTIVGLNLALILVWWWRQTGSVALTYPTKMIALGRITGLITAYGALLEVILMSRLPQLSWALGLERQIKWHKYVGYVVFLGLFLHPTFLVLGYRINSHPGLIRQFLNFVTTYRDVFKALLGSLIFLTAVISSIKWVQSKLRYELWYYAHFATYLAIILVFKHQINAGLDFVGHPLMIAYWYGLYFATAALVFWFRFAWPVIRAWVQGYQVAEVKQEASDIYSIYINGRGLGRLGAETGQYFNWRFLTGWWWLQSHPFSLSANPAGDQLRLSFKTSGDFTAKLPTIRPGTLVVMDGPNGNFTLDQSRSNRVLLIAGGIGITPIRAMLDDLPDDFDANVIYAFRRPELAFGNELRQLASKPNIKISYVTEETTGRLNLKMLQQFAPDIADRDVFVCGPPAMVEALRPMLAKLGVETGRIHSERFGY